MKAGNKGVFEQTTNRRAFCDSVVVSIVGVKKPVLGAAINKVVNQPVGGAGRLYGRKIEGVLRSSGNPCVLVYGQLKLRRVLPPMMMTIRSDGSPITADGIIEAINAVAEKGWSAKVSHVELTFDFRGVPIESLRRGIFSSAHRFVELRDAEGSKTYYVGGRTSPVQVCVYQKTRQVVRLEFKLRRPFLRRCGINKIADLVKLRDLDLSSRLRLMEVNAAELKAVERRVRRNDPDDFRFRILSKWLRDFRLCESVRAAKECFGADPQRMIMQSKLDRKMKAMKPRLII